MASNTSWRWTGTSLGATMPSRTLSPRISTTVMVMSLLMTILSFFFLDSTSIGAYPLLSWREDVQSVHTIPIPNDLTEKRARGEAMRRPAQPACGPETRFEDHPNRLPSQHLSDVRGSGQRTPTRYAGGAGDRRAVKLRLTG